MQLNINMNQIAAEAKETAEMEAAELMRRRVRQQFNAFFNNGQHWGSKKGMGYIMLEQMLDDIVTDADFEQMVRERAKSAFMAMFDQQFDYQLRRKAMKLAAKLVKEITE